MKSSVASVQAARPNSETIIIVVQKENPAQAGKADVPRETEGSSPELKTSRHTANRPVHGRSRGTGHPGLVFSIRGQNRWYLIQSIGKTARKTHKC
jgi:hypothetical protein